MSLNKSIWSSFAIALAVAGPLLLLSGCSKKSSNTSASTSDLTFVPTDTTLSGATTLHSFGGTVGDGQSPVSGLVLSGNTLYGTTDGGGPSCLGGTVFSIGVDGSNYTVLHCFQQVGQGTSPGLYPSGQLRLIGNTLYGLTLQGGPNSCPWDNNAQTITCGTIFSIGTDGSNFTILHNFAGGASDGFYPVGSLAVIGSQLYGVTAQGGSTATNCAGGTWAVSCGTIFSIGTDGSNFKLLHAFASNESEGNWPVGDLVVLGNTLYGVTNLGGAKGYGTIFSIGADGSNFTVMQSFTANMGTNPAAGMILVGTKLYGLTIVGGPSGCTGTLYSIGTDGTGFTVVYAFTNSATGDHPGGNLTINASQDTFYGVTDYGGTGGLGTLFKVGIDGTGYTSLASFSAYHGDGALPAAPLVTDGTHLYGVTKNGGIYDGAYPGNNNNGCPIDIDGVGYNHGGDCGTVFSFTL